MASMMRGSTNEPGHGMRESKWWTGAPDHIHEDAKSELSAWGPVVNKGGSFARPNSAKKRLRASESHGQLPSASSRRCGASTSRSEKYAKIMKPRMIRLYPRQGTIDRYYPSLYPLSTTVRRVKDRKSKEEEEDVEPQHEARPRDEFEIQHSEERAWRELLDCCFGYQSLL